jgi:hypothetical protein
MEFSSFSRKCIASTTALLFSLSSILSPLSLLIIEDTYAAPMILSTLGVTADGIAPFDPTTYNSLAETNTGTDANGSNGVVKAGSIIDYDVQVTVNNE